MVSARSDLGLASIPLLFALFTPACHTVVETTVGSGGSSGDIPSGGACGPSADGGACAPDLVCCYPCGIPDCTYTCTSPCDPSETGCFEGCFIHP
ncbi:Hypothetical protein A7982_06246 [Minicystis rosea]|nr:Hypothetical protein A7982_06246 [Minicystis rosea]